MERKPEQGQAKRLLWGWEGTVTFSTLKVVVWGGGSWCLAGPHCLVVGVEEGCILLLLPTHLLPWADG